MASGAYHCIILATVAAQVGAKISDEQREYLHSRYKAVGLYKEGIWQFGKLLDNYKSGEKYKLEEPDRTEERALKDEINRSGYHQFPRTLLTLCRGKSVMLMNHMGPRYYEEGVPTPDLAYSMIKKTMSKCLNFLLWPLLVFIGPILVRIFLRCLITEQVPAQQARERNHPHTAWQAPPIPSCSGCGKKAKEVEKKLKTCSRCKVTTYCSRDCQKQDFKKHKKVCAGLANKAAEN